MNQAISKLVNKNDALNNLFPLEKDLVCLMVDEMGIKLTHGEREAMERIPAKSMQAFLSYCMGLEKEDASDFQAAVQCYEKAFQLDPNFPCAGEKTELSKEVSLGAQSANAMLAAMDLKDSRTESPVATRGEADT